MLKFNKIYSWALLACFAFSGGAKSLAQETKVSLDKDSLLQGVFNNYPDRKYSYYFLEGVRQKNNGNKSGAFDLFNYCLSLDSLKPEAYYQLGIQFMDAYKLKEAVPYLTKSVELDSLNYWYNESLFLTLFMQTDKQDDAILQLESMANKFPNKTTLQFQLLQLYAKSNSYDKMLLVLDDLERKLGKNEEFSMQKFRVYILKGKEKEAFAVMKELVKAYPNDPRYKVVLADLYLSNKKEKEGFSLIKKVLKENPDLPVAIYTLANYYLQTNDVEKYLNEVEKILQDPQADSQLKLNLVRQYITSPQVDYNTVISLFELSMKSSPEDTQLPMLNVEYLVSEGKFNETKPILVYILGLDPTNTSVRLMLLQHAVKEDNYKDVIEICEQGIITSPSTIEFYYFLAVGYNQSEEYDKILNIVDRALKVVDEKTTTEIHSDFYAIKGDAYHSLGNKKEVYLAYEKALEINPKNNGVLNNYAYYLSVDRTDLEKAEMMSKKTVDAEPKNATFLDTYAWILFELKRYAEAKVYIDTALDNGGLESGVVVEHAGDIYWKTGDKEKALDYWIQADKLGAGPKIKEKISKKKYIAE